MDTILNGPIYRKAFLAYLRRGTPLELSIKAAFESTHHPIEKYIWRTQGDDLVRARHAAHEGDIIAWSEPPDIGHPGQDYNCRCVAEPYVKDTDPSDLREKNFETVIYAPEDSKERWSTADMFNHYLEGSGETVTLQEIGHLKEIIDHVQNYPIAHGHSISRRVVNDFAEQIREKGPGLFKGTFNNTYNFQDVEWAHGDSVLSGDAHGYVSAHGPFLIFNLIIDYRFSDTFGDPMDILNIQNRLADDHIVDIDPRITIEPRTPYNIAGAWRVRIEAVIYKDKNVSDYYYRDKSK